MNHISEGTASAQRLNKTMTPDYLNLHRVDTSQLGHRDGVSVGDCCINECADDESEPMTMRQFAALLLIGFASWAVVGGLIYGAFKLAEAMR